MGRAHMDHETLQALIDVYKVRASTDLLSIILDEAESPHSRTAVLDLLRSLSVETLSDSEFAPVRRKACQFCLSSGDFELADRLARGFEQPEDRAMRARALHGLGRDHEAISHYRQAIAQDPALRNRELERILGIRQSPNISTPPAKIISITTFSARREAKSETDRRDTPENFVDDFDDAVTFADVAGLEDVKDEIRRRIILPYLKPLLFDRYKQQSGGNILFYGAPGCGKTLIARATAGESDARFLSVSPDEILDKYTGEPEKRLRVFFDEARSDTPAILFFDDFDVLAFKRRGPDSGIAPAPISALLSELDGHARNNAGVLVIAATNAPWLLDPALLRAGRFQRALFVPAPPLEARKKIIAGLFAGVPGHEKIPLDYLAKKTAGLSGADLRAAADMANNAAMKKALTGAAAAEVTSSRVEGAFKSFPPSALEWLKLARGELKVLREEPGFARMFGDVYRA
jgi:SpoVK/Ycf46/Vps4 family AAA+-type ATPase